MLNLINLKLKKNNKPIKVDYKGNELGQTKHFPPASKEWFNSIYAYNKNTPKLLPIADKVITKLIKSYFNLYSARLEKKIRLSRRLRFRRKKRLSVNRIFVSRAELKHTSDKVIITLYVYNRQKKYYLNKIRKIATNNLLKKRWFKKKMRLIKIQALKVRSKAKKVANAIISKSIKKNRKANPKFKETLYYKSLKAELENRRKQYYKKIFIKSLKREVLYIYLKQIISLNKSKFENTYVLPLKSLIKKVYNKKIEFNLISLKYWYLNSDIFTEALTLKLKNRKARLLRLFKGTLKNIKLPLINKLTINDIYNKQRKVQNLKLNFLVYNSTLFRAEALNKDTLDQVLEKFFKVNIQNGYLNGLENTVLNNLKHKYISGIRFQASGRISRRITATRSLSKFRYIGSLKNKDSSFRGLSSVLLRGHFKSNLQHTKLKSKTRIGSFGVKGWVSSN